MKEIILNHFGVFGIILFILNIYMIKVHIGQDESNKYAVLGLWIIVTFAIYGFLNVFDFIGKWLLK